ncbi:two component regulator with propeller domain [Anseongella ginsenosidimutans]|uniref:histidine kinase n=1 Tax=Anseongella ginsenosidimutans TaxID=496056 RepID=A0A4R3KLX5_9SPHI|nr:ATP-binding protein [Anseongella ginsenosidimutans]QEC53564.1 response regulator [Anseongella ginsenosidimutans]TCS84636.1 two component regulator with propeller domain [Anseongella ginsenosidimutans]
MDRRLLLHLTAVLLIALTGNVRAQDVRLPPVERITTGVQALDVESGLPQGYVNGIVQDSTGFIWLGTRDGLARYDGYEVKTFHYDPRDSATIASDVIQTIYLDKKNQLWILYENAEVDIFDPVTEKIKHLGDDPSLDWLVKERGLLPFFLLQDHRGTYWVVPPELKRLRYFRMEHPAPGEVSIPPGERILALQEGGDGQMYVCTDHSLYMVSGKRLEKISDLPRRRPLRSHRISQMRQDNSGNWLIANGGYLEIFHPSRGWKAVSVPHPADYTPVYFMDRSPAGELYIASGEDVFRINADHSLTKVWTNPNKPGNIPAMMIDRANVLWAGTNTFGARLNHLSSSGFHSYAYAQGFLQDVLTGYFGASPANAYLRGVDAYSLRYAVDAENRIWLLGRPFRHRNKPEESFSGLLLLQQAGEKPASFVVHADTLRLSQFTFDDHNICWGIKPGDKQRDTILVKTDLATGAITPEPLWRPAFSDLAYITAFRDRLCIVYRKGIEVYHPASGKSMRYPSEQVFGNVQLLMATPDPKDRDVLWITSLGLGLIRFDTRDGSVQAFTVKEGLPSNSVYAAVPDKNGRFWCSSNKGVFRFDPLSHSILSFVTNDGLQGSEFNRYHFFKSPGGRIFFGGTRGWTSFHPDSVRAGSYRPETVITEILVNNKPVSAIPGWKEGAVTSLKRLDLKHGQNFITFTFAGLQFFNTSRIQYRYRLEGFDEDWVEVGNQRIAVYTNLAPGEYIFKVNSSNRGGSWSDHVKTLLVTIAPPWWKTGWAYLLYFLLFTGCACLFYRHRANRLLIKGEMIRQQEEAKHLRVMDEMKTRFFSNITHEFRTPLSLIIAPLEQMERETDVPSPVRKRLGGVRNNALRLLRLINQLLDMSKMEAGSMKVSLSRGDLGSFVESNIKSFGSHAELKNIRLQINIGLKGNYNFDADKWQKILSNLLSNAIKFTPCGGEIGVILNARYDNEQSSGVLLEVKDSGIGIPEDKLALVFNRFYQADDSHTRLHEGTGIGLALVRELTSLMNGTVEVESKPGNGTLFRILIPVEKASSRGTAFSNLISNGREPDDAVKDLRFNDEDESSVEAPEFAGVPEDVIGMEAVWAGEPDREPEAVQKPAGPPDTELILLVEDNGELSRFIAETLQGSYRTLMAVNGREALQIAGKCMPDLIISDIMMPEMNGYELCRHIKSSPATDHIAFVLLSAKASHESLIKGLENDADDYITKPFHIHELLLRVNNLIHRQRKLRRFYNKQLSTPGSELHIEEVSNLFLRKLYTIIEGNLDNEQLDVGQLAEKMAISRRTLNRKLSALVNLSAREVIQQYRLKKAHSLLQSGLSVSETALEVGFGSVSYFSKTFKAFYGMNASALSANASASYSTKR